MTEEEALKNISGETEKLYPRSNMSWAEFDRRCSAYFEDRGIAYGMKARHKQRKEKLGILPNV